MRAGFTLLALASVSLSGCLSAPGWDPDAGMSQQRRADEQAIIQRRVEARQAMCRALDPQSDRYKAQCRDHDR